MHVVALSAHDLMSFCYVSSALLNEKRRIINRNALAELRRLATDDDIVIVIYDGM